MAEEAAKAAAEAKKAEEAAKAAAEAKKEEAHWQQQKRQGR